MWAKWEPDVIVSVPAKSWIIEIEIKITVREIPEPGNVPKQVGIGQYRSNFQEMLM